MKPKTPIPPHNAVRLLTWFLREDLAEEVLGDLDEKFYSTIKNKSLRKAKLNYWRQVFNYLRPFALRKSRSTNSNYIDMFKHNLIISLRSFKYHKTSFFINLIGLSTGLACALLIYLWINDEMNIDKFHANDAQLYQVMEHVDQGTGLITRQSTAGPMADAMVEEMPEVASAVTSSWKMNMTLSIGEKDVNAFGRYVSPDYLNVFRYDLIEGDRNQVLKDKKSIVISDELATRIFNTSENVIGQIIELQHERTYQVSGIFKKIPLNSSIQFDFLLSIDDFRDRNEWILTWQNTSPQTYAVMQPGTDIDDFNARLKDYIREKTEGESNHRSPFITPFSDFYLYNKYKNGQQAGGRIDYIRLFSIIAVFIVIIACINFMNLSTARASKRIKEVGIKKTVGAYRSVLMGQYLSESVLMALFSLIIAIVMVLLLLPQFNDLTGKQLNLTMSIELISLLIGVVLGTGLLAGSYPALYLSGFNAATVLKGKLNTAIGEQWARKGLVIFQFSLSVILIVSVFVVYKQIEFVQTQNLGYDNHNVLALSVDGELDNQDKAATFVNELKNLPGVINAAGIDHSLSGHNGGTYGVVWRGKDPEDRTEFERVFIDHDLIELLGFEMVEGRSFSKSFAADTSKIIFNEAAIKFMGIESPAVGKSVTLWGRPRQIVGVVKDFHFQSFHEEIKPLFFHLPIFTGMDRIMVKIESGREQEVIQSTEELHSKFNPGFSLAYRFLDDEFQKQYLSELRVATLSQYFAGLAIIISCLGLFGLATFTAERRLKEIGIRKVLGSGNVRIISLLTKDFTKMVLVAILIALPISYLLTTNWLDSFALRIDLEWWFFVGASLLVILISWLTVAFQTLKVASVNPVHCLKQE